VLEEEDDVVVMVGDSRVSMREADAAAHLEALRATPPIQLPEYVDSALESGIFLLEQVIPALGLPDAEYTAMSAHRNNSGYAFLTYFTSQRITLDADIYGEFKGVGVDVFGGITLAFNPERKLVSALHRPVTDEDIRQIQVMTADLIRHGLVTDQTLAGYGNVLSDEMNRADLPAVQPRLLYLNDYPIRGIDGLKKLVRVPTIIDAFPTQPETFVEYLKQWK
jgi:hypothetical protein